MSKFLDTTGFTHFWSKLKTRLETIESHTTNKSNPHNVTKSQVGLGNVPNVTTNNQTPTFSQASARANITSGETLSVLLGKIAKYFADLKTVAFSGSYNDLSNKPSIPASVAVKGNAETSYRTGNVNLTPANLGITVVNNTVDSNKSVKYATSAGSATKATQDGNGENIVDTYTTKAETGNCHFKYENGKFYIGHESAEEEVNTTETDITNLKTNVSQLKTDVTQLKTDVNEVNSDIDSLNSDMDSITDRVSTLEQNSGSGGGVGNWTLLKSVTGATVITLPESFNELYIVAEYNNLHFPLLILRDELSEDYGNYVTGRYRSSGVYDSVVVKVSLTECSLNGYYNTGTNKSSDCTLTVYYR